MSATYEHIKNFYTNRKEQIVYIMGGECACCGYKKCISALELHHLNPSEKEFTISSNVNRAWEKVINELPKTILVCANCHREIHSNLIDNDKLISSFNKERANYITKKIEEYKVSKKYYCKNCGKEISRGATYCTDCYGLTQRKVIRPEREILKQEIRTMPMTQIGKKYGVSDNAVRKWCDQYGLPRKASIIKSFSDDEWSLI